MYAIIEADGATYRRTCRSTTVKDLYTKCHVAYNKVVTLPSSGKQCPATGIVVGSGASAESLHYAISITLILYNTITFSKLFLQKCYFSTISICRDGSPFTTLPKFINPLTAHSFMLNFVS